MLQKNKFSGAPPRTTLGELTRRAYVSLLPDLLADGGKGIRCPLPDNPTPVLGTSIRPRLRVLESNPVQCWQP